VSNIFDARLRVLLQIFISVCTFVAITAGAQDKFPSKPITLVVGNAPGGSNDIFARVVAKHLNDAWGQPVLVENKPAAQGLIGNAFVARAPPDGYTLAVVSSTFTTSAAIMTTLQYDPLKSFAPVAMLAKGPLLFTVANSTPFNTVSEVVAYAKVYPGKLNYATSGVGSINNFATNIFMDAVDIRLTHIPYKGMGPATTDLIAGRTEILIASAPSILSQVKAGKVRALAVTTATRSAVAPNLPTLEQSGYRGSNVDLWWGVLAPAGTPQPVVDKLNAEINRMTQSAEMKDFFLREGAEPAPMKPAEFARQIAAEIERWKKVAKDADIKPE
jgi:tripartite-type tricarboxylate transporter receptor subunit TctC